MTTSLQYWRWRAVRYHKLAKWGWWKSAYWAWRDTKERA